MDGAHKRQLDFPYFNIEINIFSIWLQSMVGCHVSICEILRLILYSCWLFWIIFANERAMNGMIFNFYNATLPSFTDVKSSSCRIRIALLNQTRRHRWWSPKSWSLCRIQMAAWSLRMDKFINNFVKHSNMKRSEIFVNRWLYLSIYFVYDM